MWRNPFRQLNKKDWCLLLVSLAVVILCNSLAGQASLSTRLGSILGVVALIFMAKGDVWGQILTVVFSVLYGITSWQFRYYGEMVTYLGMTLPMAVLAVFSWLRHPYEGNTAQVEIHRLTRRQWVWMVVLTVVVTAVLGVVLWWLKTPNLFWSTVSVITSFLASYLTFYRSSYYAIAYAANDVVLIILWVLASVKDPGFTPMIGCFSMFLLNDLYAFSSWKGREKTQHTGERK
ncbi:MAG: nicotinamide mononucleotide transporter [Clostridia bacterium]|nr:nicotinamide mononucleotide transporter [Clostridia bacterium]